MGGPRGEMGWARLFRLVFERSSNAIVLLDGERRIVDVNDAAASLWRAGPHDLIGSSISEHIAPSDGSLEAREWQAFMRTGECSGARDLVRADGSEVRVDVAVRAAIVDGRSLAVCVATTDEQHPPPPLRANSELALTNREREVVTLIALGHETDEIAAELHISSETVRTHVRNAMSKVGAHTRAQLVAIALCGDRMLHQDCVAQL
jgi:PAS domain S-box-containing protein